MNKPSISRAIKEMETSQLKPYKNNSRIHDEKQVEQISASIEKFGFTQPILIDENNIVLAGHGRLMAAQKLGLSKVPVIVLDDLSEAQKKAYVIADNKIGQNSKWNNEVLRIEIEDIAKDGFDVGILAFNDKEMTKLFDEFADVKIDDFADDTPENPKIMIECRKDDIYTLVDQINELLEQFKDAKVIYHDEQV